MTLSPVVSAAALLVNGVGFAVICFYVAKGFAALAWRHDMQKAQWEVAQGGLLALGFMLAATLLNLLELRSWRQIGFFAATFALRTLVKHSFASIPQHISALPRAKARHYA